jgi:hypothetical protein
VNEDQLAMIEDMAAHFMKPSDIAIMIGMKEDEFSEAIHDTSCEIYSRYQKGKITSIMELRRKIVKMAKNGSPQAEQLVVEFINDQRTGEQF